MKLSGKVAIITGAAGGIGREIAFALAAEGASLLLTDISMERLEKAAAGLNTKVVLVEANLINEADRANIVARCKEELGGLDILINNAGIASRNNATEVTHDELMRHFEINAYAPLALAQSALPLLKASAAADIITISSAAALNPYAGQACYCASKYAQRALMQILAMELHKDDIRVHSLAPSGVDTEMIRVTRPDLDGDAYCKPVEIAEIIVFLLTHRNNSILDELYIRRHAKAPCEP